MNGTTSAPMSIPHLVLDKVRLMSVSENKYLRVEGINIECEMD